MHRRMLVDGLLVCDSNPCHVLVAQLAQDQGMLSQGQLNMWLTGLHMHTSALPEFVTQLLDLAEAEEKVAAAAIMSASSTVHRLCLLQPSECLAHAQSFLECYLNRTLPPELRITALQSYRRTSCRGVEAPWKLLEDGSEKTEVRIAAYLALVPCAAHTSGFFTRIHKLLQQEKVQQVYSFIWTHVKNLVDKPGPSKHDQELSKLARQHTLPNKFNNDAFRTSGNFRYTHFSESMNLGGSMDANVVFSHESYVPHQVSANLTLDLLDNSFNFLDIGGEFSGIENLIESYFGKDGYFSNEDILKVLHNLRPKRNIIHEDKIQEFQKKYDAKKNRQLDWEINDIVEEEAKPSFYVRMFGNEVLYVENILQHSPAQLLYHLIQELSSPKTFKILDQEYMTPTLLGFPLRLKVNATASVSLQHEHTFHNTKKLGLQLEGSLTPSVVAAMDETLLVDAFVSSSGLRRSSTQVAKTTIGGKFLVQENEVVEVQVSVPNSEVMKVSSSARVALLKSDGKWVEPNSKIVPVNNCIDTVNEMVGLIVCTSHTNGQYEIDGDLVTAEPSEVNFLIKKTDTFNYYKLYIRQQESITEALFDTPGSTIDRKIHFLFNMNPDREGGYIVVRGAGYGIKGQYKDSEGYSGLQLEYLQESKVSGELEISMKKQLEGLNPEYIPKFLVSVGPDKFALEGKWKHMIDEDTEDVEASWEVQGAWHKTEPDMVPHAFGRVSGNFMAGQDNFKLDLNTEYGSESSDPHSISLTLNNNHTLHKDMSIVTGYASLQISQIPAGITVEYKCRPDLFELNTNTSLQDTQVSSQVVVKNVMGMTGQDTQLTLSLASEQLDLDYKASGIYKVSDNGFLAEAELNFDSSFKSKFIIMYLFEDEPLHVLAGLHLTLNDFMLQIGHSIDMTQPDHLLITASTTAGERTAGFHFEADYGSERPFNTSLEVFAGLGTRFVGLSSHIASDLQWQNFTGKSSIKWPDWSGSLDHELVLSENTMAAKFSLENMGSLELLYEASPNQAVEVVVRDATPDTTPAFMIGAKKHLSSELSILQVNLTAGDSHLVHLGWHMDSGNQFNFSLRLLESEMNLRGKHNMLENGTASGDIHAQILLPSGESISSNISLSYVKIENEDLILVSASHEENTIEGQLWVSHGGLLAEEKAGVNFTVTTPYPDFQKLGIVFLKSGGAHNLYSSQIEFDKFKILGDVQLGYPSSMLVKLEYQGGEECSSLLHLEHTHSGHQYLSIVNITLTQASKPWELVLNTSLDHSSHQHFLDTRLSVQAPVMPSPFHFQGMYNVTENQVQLELKTGLEKSVSFLYHGKKELSWKRHLLSGLGKIDASWIEPMSVNMTYDHTLGGININVVFESEEDYIDSWSAEFSSEYSSAENVKANFFLTHNDLQITMQAVHNQFESNWKQELEGSINTFTVTYNTDVEWNENLVPTKAKGSLSLFNFLDHSLDLSLSHMEESLTHISQVHGTFDDYTFDLEHKLEPKESEEGWQDYLQVTLRNVGESTGGIILTANTHGNWSAVNSSLKFESPWTDVFGADFMIQKMESSSSVTLNSSYSDKSLLSTSIVCYCWPSWKKSDLKVIAMSSYFEDFELKLQHDFDSVNLVFGEVTYGPDVHMQLGSHLNIKETWFGEEFQSYAFNASARITKFDINLKSMGAIDSHFNGTLKLQWNENNLSINSSILYGNIFEAEIRNSKINYLSKLKYELGNEALLTLNFTLQKEMENVIIFQTIVDSINPKFHAVSTLEILTDPPNKVHGKILITADLTNIDKYSLQGKLEVKSNLFATKEYGGLLDFDLNFDNELNWKGLVEVAVTGGDWDIKSGVNASLAVNEDLSHFDSGARLHLMYGNETYDLKDVRVSLAEDNNGVYELRMTLQPSHTITPRSLTIIYNHRYGALRGFLNLGDSRNYELSSRLTSRTFTVDAHQLNEDDSKWQIVEGNINWIVKRTKQLITINMKSDISSISKITGKIIVQRKRDLAVTTTLKVNDDQFHGNFRLSTLGPGRFRVDIKVDNSIINMFESEIAVELSYTQNSLTFSVKISFNENPNWIELNFKLNIKESYLKLRTPLSFLETFNITVKTPSEMFGYEIVIETPQFCWNWTSKWDGVLDLSLNMNLDLHCNKDSFFDFNFQYKFSKNPIGIFCELSAVEYGPLFKLSTTGNLTSKGIDLQLEAEVYPKYSLGLSLASQLEEESFLRMHAYDPPSNGTYFVFKTFVSPSKAELLFELPEGKSFIIKANYDFQDQPMKLSSSITNSILDYELKAEMDGEASLAAEGGNIELSLTSNTQFTHLNITGTYSFLEELKDLSFKILTPNGDADGEIQVLQDEDFLSIKADMSSSFHTFHKYHFKVTHLTENVGEKLIATITQDDIEYHVNSLKKVTDKGTEGNMNVSLPFEGYEHFSLSYNYSEDGTYQGKLNVKHENEVYVVEANHDPNDFMHQLLFNWTSSGNEYMGAIKYRVLSSSHQIETVLNIPEIEGILRFVLKFDKEGSASAMFYSPYGLLGAEGSFIYSGNTIVSSVIAHLSLFDLPKINLDMIIPLQVSERGEMKMVWILPRWRAEMWLVTGEQLKTGGAGLLIELDDKTTIYSLSYDVKDAFKLKGQFDDLNLETTWFLKGAQILVSAGDFEVKSNFPGYEAIDGSWEVGYKNWQYYCQAALDLKHRKLFSTSATLDTLSEGASYPWQNVRLNLLIESPFTSPHHLHAEYQLLTPQLLLYYQHGLDTFKIQLNSDFKRNLATLALTGNIPVQGISTFDVNVAYNFLDSYIASVVVKVEDSTLEHKFDFSPDWRVGSVQMVFTSPFLKPGRVQLSWSLVPNSVILRGFFNLGEHSGKMKMSLENTKSSADFDCQITTSIKELSQFLVNLSYKVPGNNNFDVSLAARMNNNGILMKSSLDTKGGKILLKFQGTFEILGNRGSLEVDVGPSGDGYSASAVGKFPGYEKFFIDLYFDVYQLKLNSMYDAKEVLVVSTTYSQTKIQFFWTEYWSLNLTSQLSSTGRKHLLHVTFSGFGIDPIEMEASYSQRRSHFLKLSLTSPLISNFTLQLQYSGNKVTVHTSIGEKTYTMSGRANLRRLQSSFNVRFESSDEPDNPIVMQAEYDLTDFLMGRMNSVKNLLQVTLEWEEKFQVNVTGLRNGNVAKIDIKAETPLKSLPHLHLGFQGKFFFIDFVGFNCTAFVEWSERIEMTAIAKLMQANVNAECTLKTSYRHLEKLSTSLKLEPGELQLLAQYNNDMWKAVWKYQFAPFSVTCLIETPITNYEMISLSISIKTDDEKIGADFALSWPEEQKLSVQIKVERWQLEIDFQTPWEPFTVGLFTVSLKTESEELTVSSVIQLDRHEAEVSFILLDSNVKLLASYSENSETLGLAKLEYSQRGDSMRILFEIQTPFENLESFEVSLQYGDNKMSLTFEINDVRNVIEGMYSADGGEFKAKIPVLNNFSWTLTSENTWLKANTNIAFKIPDKSEPLVLALEYDIKPEVSTFKSMFSVVHDKELVSVDVKYDQGLSFMATIMNYSLDIQVSVSGKENGVKIRLEAPESGLELLVIKMNFEFDKNTNNFKVIHHILMKQPGEEPHMYKIQGILNLHENEILVNVEFEGDGLPVYEVNIKIPYYTIGLQIMMTEDGNELLVIQYSSGFQNDLFLPQKLVIQGPAWEAQGQLLLTLSSLTASLTLPKSSQHSITVVWPEELAFEEFKITAELKSPFIPQEVLKFTFICSLSEIFNGKIHVGIVFGGKDIHVNGEYNYDELLKTFHAEIEMASDWKSYYSFQTNVQWRRDIHVTASLETLNEEHSFVCHIDTTNSAIELMVKSSLLPVKEIAFTGEINIPLDSPSFNLKSKLQAADQEIELHASFEYDQLNNIDSQVLVKKNNQDLLAMSLKMYEDAKRTDYDLSVSLQMEHFDRVVYARYYNASWGRYWNLYLTPQLFFEVDQHLTLSVINSHELKDIQSFSFSGPNFKFFAESNVGDGLGQVTISLGLDEIDFFVSGDIFEEQRIGVQVKSTFINCEVLSVYTIWSGPEQEIAAEYSGNGEVIIFDGILRPDDSFGYSVDVILKTSFEDYGKFALFTPRHKSGSHTKALLEYPGRKVGVDINLNYQGIFESDFSVGLYLPYEEFEIISLKYIMHPFTLKKHSRSYHSEVEARVGKIGFSLSSTAESLVRGKQIETVTSLNEYKGKSILLVTYAKSKRMMARHTFVFEPKELAERHSFHGEMFYEANDRIFFMVKDNKEDLIKLHTAWGAEKIFTLVTPKLLPGYIHVNLEHGSLRDDYRIEFGLLTADRGAWSVVGLQLHKEALPGGHHLFLLGQSGEFLVHVAGTLSADSCHFNNSLVFALNKNKMGYKALLLSEPGFLSKKYTSDIQVLLHNTTLYHYTQATATIKSMDLMSNFTWNKKDEQMPPITFSMNYDDKSFFGIGKKYLSAVLSHPDIKDITLHANISHTHNSSLLGSAQLVDGNSPEMKMVATMEVEPLTDDGKQTVSLSLSQPVSNFTMLMDAQLSQDPFTEALCKLRYYSLASQTWHQFNLSASLESQGSGRALTVAVVVPEEEWGHTWKGALDSRPEEASLFLEGSSLEQGDTWKLNSVVKRHIPELAMYLSVGKEEEVYEEARVRLGLHSPVEAGAIVDHLRFGEWHQDVALGLRLTSPRVLQAFLDFNPSLDYKDYQDWVRLFSPSMEVLEVWKRDVVTATQNFKQWVATEAPTVIGALVNNETVLAMYKREASNWDYFMKDVQDTYQGITEDAKTFWESVLVPVFTALEDYSIKMYIAAMDYLSDLKEVMLHNLQRAALWLQNLWHSFLSKMSFVEASAREKLVEWGVSLDQGASFLWVNFHQWITWLVENVSREVANLLEQTRQFFIMTRDTVQGYLSLILQAIQPYFEGLPEAFHSYGQEVLAEFSGPCWMAVTDKWNSLAAMGQNLDGMRIVSEFLQIEKYFSHLVQARDWLKNTVASGWTDIHETLSGVVEEMVRVFSSWGPALTEYTGEAWNTLSQLSTEGLYPLVMSMTGDLQEKVSQVASQLPTLLRKSIAPMQSYFIQFSVFRHIDDAMTGIYEWVKSAWERWSLGEHSSLGFLEQQLFLLGDAVSDYLSKTNYLMDQLFVFKPRVLGHVFYNQYLPGHWTSFMELPSWTFPTHLFQTESATREAERLMAAASPNPSLVQSIMPFYTATAIIAGQHITTFDLYHYQFLGSCSYLLAKDFEGGDFEVFALYETEAGATRLKSVVVHSQNTDVTLGVDGSVTSIGSGVLVYNNTDYNTLSLPNLSVSCSKALHGCALTVSNKYFGTNRLGGLLGNFNGDASDDFHGPSCRVPENAAHLATMWAISTTPCYQANQANIVEDYNDVEEESVRECSQLFLYGASPLRDCFHVIDPHPYFTHCIQGHTHPAFSEHDLNSPCTAVASYRTQCWIRHIDLPDLDKCKNESSSGCVVEGKKVPYGWSQVYEETSHGSADVAFIVELTDCNAGRDVASLFDYIARQLERGNINDVRYSVVAVGGEETVTKSFLSKRNTTDFLNTLSFNETKPSENIEALVASTAAKIEWRPGVARSIVHFRCQVCKGDDDATKVLHQNDVTYHLISGLMVEMAGTHQEAQARTRKLFGFDENLVYGPGDFKKYKGNEKLRLALRSPKDGCVAMALSTGGSVFDANKWTPKKAIQTKKFLSVLAKRVAASSSPPKCQECHCLKGDSRAMPTCFKCFGNSVFLITQMDNSTSAAAKDNNSVVTDIKRSFQENFLKSNSNITMLRIL
ncbi:hypothetical protein O3P69_005901 [Scylla paramamosain]|uniref:VWFD domain-containing protein n=1 Tax=Scylla paramamosain TaxID=85552 RepID=A0AAW0U7J7_SCYPA